MPLSAAERTTFDEWRDTSPLEDVIVREPLRCVVLASGPAENEKFRQWTEDSRFRFILTPVDDAEGALAELHKRETDIVLVGGEQQAGEGSFAAAIADDARLLGVPMLLLGDGFGDAEVADALRRGVADVLNISDVATTRLDQAVEAALRRQRGPVADQLALISNLQAENETLRRIAARNMRLLKGQTLPLMSIAWRMLKGEVIREEDRSRYAKGLARATRNVTGLIDDTVIVAATHRAQELEEAVDLNLIVEAIIRDDLGEIANSRAHVVAHSLPVLWARRPHMEMLFEEVLLTAVRNRRVGRVPEIELGCSKDEQGNPIIWMLEKGLQLSARKQALALSADMFAPPSGRELEDGHAWSLCQRLVERNHGQFRISESGESEIRVMMRFPKRLLTE